MKRAHPDDFIQLLPKAELHLHLEGALPWDAVRARVGTFPASPPWWSEDFRFRDFSHFAEVIHQVYGSGLSNVEDYRLAAEGVFAALLKQNVRYVELSFSLGHAAFLKLSPDEVVEAIQGAAPRGLVVRVFGGISRSRPQFLTPQMATVLTESGLDGLDLHGDENLRGPEAYAELYALARARGLATKAHAGELAGPRSIRAVLDALQVKRIEHGITAIQDKALLARLADEAITLDLCPTSNLKLGVVQSAAEHPIRRFFERGVRVTVSTDNPTILGCSLTSELKLLVEHLGFSLPDLIQLQRNAFSAANLSATQRAAIMDELEALRDIVGDR